MFRTFKGDSSTELENNDDQIKSSYASYLLPLTFIALNCCIAAVYLLFKPFDNDEFQHVHIAWNLFQYHEILYKDFWDDHGFIYPVINMGLFKLFHFGASIATFHFLRLTSCVYLLILLGITYKLSVLVFRTKGWGVLSAGILSGLYFFIFKGIEIRPDTLQNVFWLGGLYFALQTLQRSKMSSYILAGVLFGLAVATNLKAAFGIIFVGLFFLGMCLFEREFRRTHSKGFVAMIVSACAVFAIPLLGLFLLGGLNAYYQSNVLFNFALLHAQDAPWMFPTFWHLFVIHQLSFLLASLLGLIVLCILLFKKQDLAVILFTMVAVGTSLGALLGLYSQFYLMFLPLLAIIAAYGLGWLMQLWRQKGTFSVWADILLLLVFFVPLEYFLVGSAVSTYTDQQILQLQQSTQNFVLSETPRDEAVAAFWHFCGGYVFNRNLQYYWWFELSNVEAYEAIKGYDPYGESFVQNLKEKNTRLIIAESWEIDELFSSSTRQYILDNYERVSECVMERKTATQ